MDNWVEKYRGAESKIIQASSFVFQQPNDKVAA